MRIWKNVRFDRPVHKYVEPYYGVWQSYMSMKEEAHSESLFHSDHAIAICSIVPLLLSDGWNVSSKHTKHAGSM